MPTKTPNLNQKKGLQEDFAKLFDTPDRVSFINFFKNNTGEHNYIDFKKEWPELPKVAKHILGFANSGGGILVIGAEEKDDGCIEPKELDKMKDKTDVKSGLAKYLPTELEFEIHNFSYGNEAEWKTVKNKKFQILIINDQAEYLPFLSLSTSGDLLHKNRVYVRSKTSTDEVTHEELKKIINRRLETQISTSSEDEFRNKINQLKILYSFLDKRVPMIWNLTAHLTLENPNYPEEDFDKFIARMIEKKKKDIDNS